ncbi:hypothetical protein ACQP25_44790 (plasmid) [Microtetraspora malaysiensis]|uniref:hypothetical protein n=1 Tax=Microtetraspora malaysiensis TaxID=161358 RepID=UPI003D9468E4
MTHADLYRAIVDDLTSPSAEQKVPPAAVAANRLRNALAGHQIFADVNHDDRIAFVSVAPGLLVLSDGKTFKWPTGERRAGIAVMARDPVTDPVTAASHIAARYGQIMQGQPQEAPVPDSMRNPI